MGRYIEEDLGAKNVISIIETLPENVLHKIFSFLGAADGIRVGCVSKDYQKQMISSTKCVYNDDLVTIHNPWFFRFNHYERHVGSSFYECDAQSWRTFNLNLAHLCSLGIPSLDLYHCRFSASHGLICITYGDTENAKKILICNPILKRWRELPNVPTKTQERCLVTVLSVDIQSKTYYTVVVKGYHKYRTLERQEVGIELYDPKKKCWTNLYDGYLVDAYVGFEAAICNGILYFEIRFKNSDNIALLPYDLSSTRFEHPLTDLPVLLLPDGMCQHIINMCGKLIVVGYTENNNIWKLIIWELSGKEWKVISTMPREIMDILFPNYQRLALAELILFAIRSCGINDFVYIYSSSSKDMATFNLSQKIWMLVEETPISNKKKSSGLFYGFCFEPRLDILP